MPKKRLQKQGGEYSRHEIHKMLWRKCDRFGRIKINQSAWMKDLGISMATMQRIMAELRSEGRIKKIGSRKMGIGIYVIRDPNQEESWQPIPQVPKEKPLKVPDSEAVSRGTA